MATYPASIRQVAFIENLLKERQIPEDHRKWVRNLIDTSTLTSRQASLTIDQFVKFDKIPNVVESVDPERLRYRELLDALPVAHYVIKAADLEEFLTNTDFHGNENLFVGVRTLRGGVYKGRKVMSRLIGGGYGTSYVTKRLDMRDALLIAEFLNKPDFAYRAAQEFGRLHGECGSCGKNLTDDLSLRLHIGPECRKKFGHR